MVTRILLRRSRNLATAKWHAAMLSSSVRWGNLWCTWAAGDRVWTTAELDRLFPEHEWREVRESWP